MSGLRSERLIVEDMIGAAQRLVELGAECAPEPLGLDQTLGEGVLFNIIILGEAAKRASIETRASFPLVPWRELARTRDRLVHHYEGVDWEVVQQIIDVDLPRIIPLLHTVRDTFSDGAAP